MANPAADVPISTQYFRNGLNQRFLRWTRLIGTWFQLAVFQSKKSAGRPDQLFFLLEGAAFLADFCGGSTSFWSPITVVNGQTLNTGHFLQPTANATGQMTMLKPRVMNVCGHHTRATMARYSQTAGTPNPPARQSFARVDPVTRSAASRLAYAKTPECRTSRLPIAALPSPWHRDADVSPPAYRDRDS